MMLPASICSDIDTAHDLSTRDISPVWLKAVAAMLERSAKDIRLAAEAEEARQASKAQPS